MLRRGLLRDGDDVPEEMRDAAKVYLEHSAAQGQSRRSQTADVLDALDADRIRVLALKGASRERDRPESEVPAS
jgi:hypothetical protein